MTDTLLLNDFYTVHDKVKTGESSFTCGILFDASHAIFKGHFEQMPVVPGVCQSQMIMELLQEELGLNLLMHQGDNIKFTGMIVPTQHPKVLAEISYSRAGDIITAEAKIYFETITFTKFKGTFKPA
jgi:3-hydroxyacyl-[acyl-carrier-protein] dehydratase